MDAEHTCVMRTSHSHPSLQRWTQTLTLSPRAGLGFGIVTRAVRSGGPERPFY